MHCPECGAAASENDLFCGDRLRAHGPLASRDPVAYRTYLSISAMCTLHIEFTIESWVRQARESQRRRGTARPGMYKQGKPSGLYCMPDVPFAVAASARGTSDYEKALGTSCASQPALQPPIRARWPVSVP